MCIDILVSAAIPLSLSHSVSSSFFLQQSNPNLIKQQYQLTNHNIVFNAYRYFSHFHYFSIGWIHAATVWIWLNCGFWFLTQMSSWRLCVQLHIPLVVVFFLFFLSIFDRYEKERTCTRWRDGEGEERCLVIGKLVCIKEHACNNGLVNLYIFLFFFRFEMENHNAHLTEAKVFAFGIVRCGYF